MIVIGLDPGLATTGVGIISVQGSKHTYLYHGAIRTPAKTDLASRLLKISEDLNAIISRYKPTHAAVEKLFFNTNKTSAIDVAQARGVLVLILSTHGIPMGDYTPIQVKSAVCGYGRADKKQVQYMVKKLLNLSKAPTPDDAADGLALAICHGHSHRLHSKL